MRAHFEDIHNVELPITSFSEITTPMKEEKYEEKLWTHSLAHQGKGSALFKTAQGVFFGGVNIAVNWFSLEGNYREKISPEIRYTANVLFALATFDSNLFSKILPELGNKVEGLELDIDRGILKNIIFDGPQTRFYTNLARKLAEGMYESEHTRIVVAIDPSNLQIYRRHHFLEESEYLNFLEEGTQTVIIPKKFINMARLLQAHYQKTYKKDLIFINRNDLTQYQQNFYQSASLPQKLVILTSFKPNPEEIEARTQLIRFYDVSWLARLWHDFKNEPFSEASFTALKALGATLLWNISKGFPGLVVLLTGTVALSGIEGATLVESRFWRGVIFVINFFVSLLGKTLINNSLKGNDTDRELHKLFEKLFHCPRTIFDFDVYKALLSMLVTLISVFPYVICTAWFYTAEGLQNALNECNYIFNTDFTFSPSMADFITFSAVLTSVPLAFVTNTQPFYNYLKKASNASATHAVTTQAVKALWYSFVIASLLDSIKFGDNAAFNVDKTWGILENRYPGFANFADDYALAEPFTRYIIAAGVAILSTVFCMAKAEPNFDAAMKLSKQVFYVTANSVSSIAGNCCGWFTRSGNGVDIQAVLLSAPPPEVEEVASLQGHYRSQFTGVS
ncbi:MAG: hypothetical protein A3F10_04000 [Coxiella sp. RIFCSPHIGHO2_12_FULL_42_15]|nr:MAG: hypothetical protein A3F10_04000 [Coxiella sp. RIFCSPHIGHO2_12_FULL_42_15]